MEGSPSNLTSPDVTTGESTDCLDFFFLVTGDNATLMVSIRRKNNTKTILWKYMSNNYITERTWSYATLPIKSPEDFKVIIESLPTSDTRSVIAVDQIKHYRNHSCVLSPSEAEVDQTTSPSTSTTRPEIVSSSLRPKASTNAPTANLVNPNTTYPHAGHTDDDKEKEPDTTDNSTTVLAGAVTAGVVLLVIIVVIAGFVIWKTRINSKKAEEIANDNMEPSRETAAAPDITSATETHYDGLGELSPQSHYTSLVGTQSASEAAASYYNVDSSQPGRHGPRKTLPAETPYESLGEPSPLSVYTSLQNTAAASDMRTYYSNDFAQDNGSYCNVTPGNSA